jgi:hypothetical protein
VGKELPMYLCKDCGKEWEAVGFYAGFHSACPRCGNYNIEERGNYSWCDIRQQRIHFKICEKIRTKTCMKKCPNGKEFKK